MNIWISASIVAATLWVVKSLARVKKLSPQQGKRFRFIQDSKMYCGRCLEKLETKSGDMLILQFGDKRLLKVFKSRCIETLEDISAEGPEFAQLSLQPSILATAGSLALAIEEHVLRTVSPDLLYKRKKGRSLAQLPVDLLTWRTAELRYDDDHEQLWLNLDFMLEAEGFSQWTYKFDSHLRAPGSDVLPNGYLFTSLHRMADRHGSIKSLRSFQYMNPLIRALRMHKGQDVIMRVIAIGENGRKNLDILRILATSPQALISANHTLPMIREVQLGHITFGVFPLVGYTLDVSWANNSVGDILDMLLQALEGLSFIHNLGIAHRDAFRSNFLVQWHPESLLAGMISRSKPRVYIIDFEVAVQFPTDCPSHERLCTGIPCDGSMTDPTQYRRPCIPEMLADIPYDPFKLDVWQLGYDFHTAFDFVIPDVETVIRAMASNDASLRLTANEVLSRLDAVVSRLAPQSLHIPPIKAG